MDIKSYIQDSIETKTKITETKEKRPSSVVNLPSFRSNLALIAFNTGIEPLTWHAVPSQHLISYLPLGSNENCA